MNIDTPGTMDYKCKLQAYDLLVKDVRNCPKLTSCNKSNSNNTIELHHCDFCNEINLWSYWQGGRECLNAEILLVGQDWGNYSENDENSIIQLIKRDEPFIYCSNSDSQKSPTDKNLCRLFESIGYEDISKNRYNTLFFTNYVLCYRRLADRISSGFRKIWAKNCKDHFIRLVEIIEPKVIICLGRSVFQAVMEATGQRSPTYSYNQIIDEGARAVRIGSFVCNIFPMAHCGILGTNNRNRPKKYNDPLLAQISDWEKIKNYI